MCNPVRWPAATDLADARSTISRDADLAELWPARKGRIPARKGRIFGPRRGDAARRAGAAGGGGHEPRSWEGYGRVEGRNLFFTSLTKVLDPETGFTRARRPPGRAHPAAAPQVARLSP
jgi:hypothetical protein